MVTISPTQSPISGFAFKPFFQKYLIDAFTGMAQGLFVTLIAGLILSQIGTWLGLPVLINIGKLAGMLMGAGIGAGIAYHLKAPTLVVLSCIVVGMMGAHSTALLSGTILNAGGVPMMFKAVPGNPVAAYLTSVFAYAVGSRLVGKTRLDILLIPMLMCLVGLAVAAWLCPSVVWAVDTLGHMIKQATELQPFWMGIIVAAMVGLFLTMPTSSAAICIAMDLGGLAGGAAVVGCAAHMVGFAVASFRDNGVSGLIAQGLGSSKLQIPNVFKKPIILLPAVIASMVVGPLATVVFGLHCGASGSGMGTSGLVGVFGVVEASSKIMPTSQMWLAIVLLMFIIPAVVAGLVSFWLYKTGKIQRGDMKLINI